MGKEFAALVTIEDNMENVIYATRSVKESYEDFLHMKVKEVWNLSSFQNVTSKRKNLKNSLKT